jgi:hypothetical protein
MRRSILKLCAALGIGAQASPLAAHGPMAVDPRLLGRWRSDRERTLQRWCLPPDASAEARERFGAMLGRLVLDFSPTHLTAEQDGVSTHTTYRVVATDFQSVVIERRIDDGRPLLEQVFFEGRRLYKVAGGQFEYFERIGP